MPFFMFSYFQRFRLLHNNNISKMDVNLGSHRSYWIRPLKCVDNMKISRFGHICQKNAKRLEILKIIKDLDVSVLYTTII